MKKIMLVCAALLMTAGIVMAENKPVVQKTVKTVFCTDIDCDHCKAKVLNNIPVLGKGVKDVQVDVPSKKITVVYDPSKNSDENLVKAFAKIKVKAEPEKK